MDLTINGQPANITLEKEETVGELLSGIEQWLQGTDYCLSGITIDGISINSSDISQVFPKRLENTNTIDIRTSSWLELYLEALIMVQQYLETYEKASFEDKKVIQASWEEGAAASFIKSREVTLFSMLNHVFSGEGLSSGNALMIITERIRELENPGQEIGNMQQLIEECAKRLEDLPLDLQTGKDLRAAETIQLFSGITEKLFRIISMLELQGTHLESIKVEDQPFKNFVEEFSTALQELISAYGSKDSVLVGDLAEYELAPRLRTFYKSINDPVLFGA